MNTQNSRTESLKLLYEKLLPASRTGPLYNAFSYPTKISPEVIAVFIATHTKPGATILDAFGGSGTTGVATLLCDRPTPAMHRIAEKLGITPAWGPRKAHVFEVGVLGAFVSRVLCNPPEPDTFAEAAAKLVDQAEKQIGWIYETVDSAGKSGSLRHTIWSDVLVCPNCQAETSYWDATVRHDPLQIADSFDCPSCNRNVEVKACTRATETVFDTLTGNRVKRKKRVLAHIYGQSGSNKWKRAPIEEDYAQATRMEEIPLPTTAPVEKIMWGDLYRSGYHTGITHLHHFYTRRNFLAVATLWDLADAFPEKVRDALRLLILSYNSSHSTLMTRVVVKNGQGDFVITGSQSGVLYISGLPVEKNVFKGISRKARTFVQAFSLVYESVGEVQVHNVSSENIDLPTSTVDYVFTDPPFGDYIPYAELNQVNELWLGKTTDRSKEIIISDAQQKSVADYRIMMSRVFSEIARVLKPDGVATVVFHSARPEIWQALTQSYTKAGLSVQVSSILNKTQASFKQIVSKGSVKGDPLILLSKGQGIQNPRKAESIISEIFDDVLPTSDATVDAQLLYSRFVSRSLELGVEVEIGAKEFYARVKDFFEKEQ